MRQVSLLPFRYHIARHLDSGATAPSDHHTFHSKRLLLQSRWRNTSIKKGLFSVLVALIIVALLFSATVSADREEGLPTTLAIEVGSSATRMSVLVGENGLVFGDNGEPTIISIGPGARSMSGPLESNWTTGGFLLIKDGTDEALYVHPSNTYFNLDLPTAIRSECKFDNRPNITGYQAFTLIDITSKYLQGLVTSAQSILGQNITLAVVVIPDGQNVRTTAKEIINHKFKGNYTHYDSVVVGQYDSPCCEERMMAEALAGVEHQGIYSEHLRKTSAAIFPFSHHMEYSRGVLIYRLGSSTFEVSVFKVDGGSTYTMSSVYDQRLGGNDFNQRVVDHLLLAHKNKTSQKLHSEDMYLPRLGNEVEKAKRVLSVQDVVRIEIESPHPGGQDLSEQLTRSQFEDLNMDLFTKTITAIDQAIKDSVVYTKDDIQDIVFSGGSANIPFLQLAVREYFGRHKRYHGSNHPETTVVSGAAKRGHWYQDERHYGGDVCCLGERRRTLGIETTGGAMFKYTDRTSGLDIDKMYTFSTALDNQDRVVIRVFSGNGKWTNQNTFLGGVELTGIAPSPKGVPQIRVRLSTYSCGRSINLNVMDVASGRTNATIFSLWPRFDDFEKINYGMLEGGAFELEPAGKLILLPEYR